jgi:excinuclease ABC subunit B
MDSKKFQLHTNLVPSGDQPQAIKKLTDNIKSGQKEQVLLGVTGSGKTFTMAHVIQALQLPTLVFSHNKTLAAQLYQEFREFFPENAVSYFVSYYDYYQPESYIPQTDTYIEKETEINEDIDRLRLSATTNLLTRADTIVVASVSCIYNIGSPREYGMFILEMKEGMSISKESIIRRLVQLQYERSAWDFKRGTFRVRGESLDLFPSYEDNGLRIIFNGNRITGMHRIDPVTGKKGDAVHQVVIYPSKHYMTDPASYSQTFKIIRDDLTRQINYFNKSERFVEARRIQDRVNYDLEMIETVGYVNGIENYSRYFDHRNAGDPPYTLLDYFDEAGTRFHPEDPTGWLLFIDESHITIPQIRGMYNGDRTRKQTLIDYGFRLPAALDNRPLTFDEFSRKTPTTVYVSATPDLWERQRAASVVEQLVRPTGLVDPEVSVRPSKNQIEDLTNEIQIRVSKHERILVTTLTKRMAEDLSAYLKEKNVQVTYLHADIQTLKRTGILSSLRKGEFDVLVGVNLLREGLDLPEVTLVAILDADKEGFLRNEKSLIQTMGRAARNLKGEVILYADSVTKSMDHAIAEARRRRKIQQEYNKKHHIIPTSITKPVRDALVIETKTASAPLEELLTMDQSSLDALTAHDRDLLIKKLQKEMIKAGKDLQFELAAQIRDAISILRLVGN